MWCDKKFKRATWGWWQSLAICHHHSTYSTTTVNGHLSIYYRFYTGEEPWTSWNSWWHQSQPSSCRRASSQSATFTTCQGYGLRSPGPARKVLSYITSIEYTDWFIGMNLAQYPGLTEDVVESAEWRADVLELVREHWVIVLPDPCSNFICP